MLFVDGTNIKAINDLINHERGDEAIKGLAQVLRDSLRPEDIIARVGGDEFIVLMSGENREAPEQTSDQQIEAVEKRIASTTAAFLDIEQNQDIKAKGMQISVGGAIWPAHATLEDTRDLAEARMEIQKKAQHLEVGQYRPSQPSV